MHVGLSALCGLFLLMAGAGGAAKAQTASAQGKRTCHINTESPSEADDANSRGDYAKAATLYKDTVAKSPTDLNRAGQIRNLLDDNKITEAVTLANDFAKAEPSSAVAVETMGEVRFREGDLPESYVLMAKAMQMDPCNARVYYGASRYESLAGLHATAKRHITVAHQLDPMSNDIHLAWMGFLPRKERLAARQDYVANSKLLDEKRRARMKDELDHAKIYSENDCTVVSSGKQASIPFQPLYSRNEQSGWGLDVQFNGKSRTLRIDTGASGLLLTRGAANGLGLTREETVLTAGVGNQGAVKTYIAHVDRIRIGDMEFRNCAVRVLAVNGAMGGGDQMGERMDSQDGLIGSDVFAKYLVTLDYPAHQLRLAALPKRPEETATEDGLRTVAGQFGNDGEAHDRYIAPEMQKWTRVYRGGHEILMPTRTGSAGTKLFLVDTGAFTNMISPDAAREVTKVKEDGLVMVRGLSGYVSQVFEAGKFTMDFAGMRQPMRSMTSIDTTGISNNLGVQVSGFLGYPTLSQLVMRFDYRDNLVQFEYVPQK